MCIDLIVTRRVIEKKQLIYVAKGKGHKQNAFQTDDMGLRYECTKHYHILYMNCATGTNVSFSDCDQFFIFYLYAAYFLQKTR